MFSKIFRNNCFEKHLRTIASIYNFKNLCNTLNASLSSYRNQSVRSALRNFAKFTRKNLCYFVATCLKKRQVHRCFPLNFLKFLRTPFLQNTSGRLFLDCLQKNALILREFKLLNSEIIRKPMTSEKS